MPNCGVRTLDFPLKSLCEETYEREREIAQAIPNRQWEKELSLTRNTRGLQEN